VAPYLGLKRRAVNYVSLLHVSQAQIPCPILGRGRFIRPQSSAIPVYPPTGGANTRQFRKVRQSSPMAKNSTRKKILRQCFATAAECKTREDSGFRLSRTGHRRLIRYIE
jgi:hypothetical protein